VFIGRSGRDDVLASDDNALIALARREVAERLDVSATPSLIRVHRWPLGMPQYVLGHPERIARIEATLRDHPGLYLSGNAYHGVGLPDCITSGERAAAAAVAQVYSTRTESASIDKVSATIP
jgi:oxygen-dependent protoporphyrinogen oxidase